MDIRPYKTKKRKAFDVPYEQMPQFHTAIVAPSGSGKSVLIGNLIDPTRPDSYYHSCHSIVIFSPTAADDEPYTHAMKHDKKKQKISIFPEVSEERLEFLLDHLMSREPVKGRERCCLVIFEDVMHDLRNSKGLRRLLFSGRHCHCYCWLATQSYRQIPLPVRVNLKNIIAMAATPASQLRQIAEEHEVPLLPAIMEHVHERHPYGFMLINKELPPSRQGWLNFTQPVDLIGR